MRMFGPRLGLYWPTRPATTLADGSGCSSPSRAANGRVGGVVGERAEEGTCMSYRSGPACPVLLHINENMAGEYYHLCLNDESIQNIHPRASAGNKRTPI